MLHVIFFLSFCGQHIDNSILMDLKKVGGQYKIENEKLYISASYLGPSVTKIFIRDKNGSEKLVEVINKSGITDEWLVKFSALKRLYSLKINGAKISSLGLENIAKNTSLRILDISECPVSNFSMIKLKSCNLFELYIAGTEINDQSIGTILTQNNIKVLDVSNTKIGDAFFSQIYKLNRLETFYSSDTSITNKGLQIASKTGLKLKVIDLSRNKISDFGSDLFISHQKYMEKVFLFGTELSDEGVTFVSKCPNIQVLGLNRTNITDKGLETICVNKNINKLYIGNTRISDDGVKQLIKLKNLEVLDIYRTRITGKGVALILDLPKLKEINIAELNVGKDIIETLKRKGIKYHY